MASHRRPSQPGFTHGARVTVLSAAAATAAAALGAAPPASADPHETAEGARAAVDRLYEEAEKATEQFNKAEERVERLRERVAQAQDRVARGQEAVNRMRAALGSLAGAQYRSGGMDPSLALLLSEDPDGYLDKAVTLDRISERQATALSDLREAQRRIGQERAEAGRDLAELEQGRKAVARHKRLVEGKLAEAQRLLNALTARERAAYDEERASRSGRGESLPEMTPGLGPASARAAAAAAAARSAVGRPYVWGANGPSGFDCSGLMQWAYAQAGVGLPRTSQAQRYAGRQVPLSQARPGDLVTYRSDASHVGMYMGNGQVVHAPYPGASVRYDPVGMMPIASVTRV
ncbi:NlpC/P60 family protein [Streptomyces sp. PR69]|uniref:C40 family peptidase n=1 Tax=Streptomyces sp. PR69 TaxID=2984950 RepID=UPI002264323E|nr:C40 family peptidase [Streptomyces sp. PR69]